jgi:hypothetical protein
MNDIRRIILKISLPFVCLLAFAMSTTNSMGKEPLEGGFSNVSLKDKDVIKAAEFAVKTELAAMQKKNDKKVIKLTLVKILGAQQQVVAGMNYMLKLKVKLNGKEKIVEATVWWQDWRKADPFKLTSWKAK